MSSMIASFASTIIFAIVLGVLLLAATYHCIRLFWAYLREGDNHRRDVEARIQRLAPLSNGRRRR